MCRVVISGGATPRRKNSAQPNGGVRNDDCRLTRISIASQTRSTSCRDEDRQEQRHRDVADLDPLDEEAEDEDQRHQEPDVGADAAGQQLEQVLDQLVALQAAEGEAEHLRADQDEQHHRRDAQWSSA